MKTFFCALIGLVSLSSARAIQLPGTLDVAFKPELDGPVISIAPLADGKAYIAGSFRNVNGVARPGLARLNPDGTLDSSFNPGSGANAPGYYTALLAQPGGNLLVTGSFTNFNGAPRYGVVRLMPDGTVDPNFHSDSRLGTNAVDCVAWQPDGNPIIGGNFGSFVEQTDFPGPLARLNADGTVDDSFAPVITHDWVSGYMGMITTLPLNMGDLIVQTNGDILFRATYDQMDTAQCPPGTQIRGYHDATAIAVDAEGKVLAEGYYIQSADTPKHREGQFVEYFWRYGLDGTRDYSFTPQVGTDYRTPLQILPQVDGKIMVIGAIYSPLAKTNTYIARLHPNGFEDQHFKASTDQPARVLARQADGSYWLGGNFQSVNGVPRSFLAHLYGDDSTPRPPLVVSQPARVEVPEGLTTNLTAVIDGPALFYQWQFNGQTISGATNEYLFITNATVMADGLYSLVASNGWGAITSAPVRLAVRQKLAEALNTTNLTWKTAYVVYGQPAGTPGWGTTTNAANQSGLGVMSSEVFDPYNQVDPGKYYVLQTQVTGPGVLGFWGYGGGHFGFAAAATNRDFYPPETWSYRADFETGSWPFGPFEWRQYFYNIPEGQQVVAWADENKFGPAAAIDEVTFVPAPERPVIQWQRPAGGSIALAILGKTGAIYDLESTADFGEWTKVMRFTNQPGLINFSNLPPTTAPFAFYRVVRQTNIAGLVPN